MYNDRLKSLGSSLVLVSLLGVCTTAHAQTTAQGAAASEQADAHFLKGKALLKASNVRGAYDEYKAAWELKHTYDIAANLGNLELSLGMPRDAAAHLAFSVRNYATTGTTPERLEKTRQLFEQARAQVGTLTIKVNVEGAEVFVDGRSVGRAPIDGDVFVDPGSRKLEARLSGYLSAETTIGADKGSSRTVELSLSALTGPVPPPPGGGTVLHKRSVVPGVVLAALGGAATLVSVGVFVDLGHKVSGGRQVRDDIRTSGHSCVMAAANFDPRCPALDSTAETANRESRAGFGLLVGGGLAAASSVAYFLWPASEESKPSARAVPVVSTTGVGVVLSGSF